ITRAVLDWCGARAAARPFVLLFEDLHWADASSVELLRRLITADVPGLLTLVTSRPLAVPPFDPATIEVLPVRPLPRQDAHELVSTVPGGDQLDQGTVTAIVARADGVPLFLEQMVRAAAGADGPSSVPTSLRDLLQMQLDAL